MAKQNTRVMRADPKFKELIDNILEKKPRSVKTPRVTRAIYNQYKKYPAILKELLEADLR